MCGFLCKLVFFSRYRLYFQGIFANVMFCFRISRRIIGSDQDAAGDLFSMRVNDKCCRNSVFIGKSLVKPYTLRGFEMSWKFAKSRLQRDRDSLVG